mgnify:CR=1 FL=1
MYLTNELSSKSSIKDWSVQDRPREKLLTNGRKSLTDVELLAIILGSGNLDESAVDLGALFTRIVAPDYKQNLKVQGLEFIFRPNTFKDINNESQQAYQQQKILSVVMLACHLFKSGSNSLIIFKISSPLNSV